MAQLQVKAYYGVPEDIRDKALTFLDDDLVESLDAFGHCIGEAQS